MTLRFVAPLVFSLFLSSCSDSFLGGTSSRKKDPTKGNQQQKKGDPAQCAKTDLLMKAIEIGCQKRSLEIINNNEQVMIAVNGLYPVHLAAQTYLTDVFKALIDHEQVDLNLVDSTPLKRTSLHHAAVKNRRKNIAFLLEKEELDINLKDDKTFSALMLAAKENQAKAIQELLKSPKIKINLKDQNEKTAFFHYIEKLSKMSDNKVDDETMRAFINYPQFKINEPSIEEKTVLDLAIDQGKESLTLFLIRNNAKKFEDL